MILSLLRLIAVINMVWLVLGFYEFAVFGHFGISAFCCARIIDNAVRF